MVNRGPRQKGGEGGLPWETVPFAAARTERKKEINSERGRRGGQNQIEGRGDK